MRALLIAGLLFAAACGGKSDSETMDPCKDPCKDQKMAAMTCDGMADAVAAATTAAGEIPQDAVATVRGVFVDECVTNDWSQESIDCVAAATNNEQGQSCVQGLSEEQKTSFRAAMDTAVEGMDGGGGEEGGME